MPYKVAVNLDMSGNQIVNALLQILSSDPGSPVLSSQPSADADDLDELAGKIADVRDDSRVRYCQRRRAGIRAQLQERGHRAPPTVAKIVSGQPVAVESAP